MSVYYTPKLTMREVNAVLGHDWISATNLDAPANREQLKIAHARIHERAEAFIRDEILCNDSWLIPVLEAAGEEGFGVDDWENVYPDPSAWSLEECREWLDQHGIDPTDHISQEANPWDYRHTVDTLADAIWLGPDEPTSPDTPVGFQPRQDYLASMIAEEERDGLEEWRDAVRDADPAEPFEWWRVSKWLCNKLRDAGEVVIDNGYGQWWGRCCTGQAIILDGTIQKIAHGLLAS